MSLNLRNVFKNGAEIVRNVDKIDEISEKLGKQF